MNKKRIMVVGMLILLAVGVWVFLPRGEPESPRPTPYRGHRTMVYFNFEGILQLPYTTDVVIARYVGRRYFGEALIEFEFEVLDRIHGNAADTIFVYADTTFRGSLSTDDGRRVSYYPGALELERGVDYLIPLWRILDPYATTHEDGYRFGTNIVIDLDNPSNSNMYSEPLADHAWGMDFNDPNLTREEIIAYVAELTRDNEVAPEIIWSTDVETIIQGSPYVLVVEIEEPIRLSEEALSDWRANDIYYVRVVQSLRGEVYLGDEADVLFQANTVFPGERHIVAVERFGQERNSFDFTSRNSLFSMDELGAIMEIIENLEQETE